MLVSLICLRTKNTITLIELSYRMPPNIMLMMVVVVVVIYLFFLFFFCFYTVMKRITRTTTEYSSPSQTSLTIINIDYPLNVFKPKIDMRNCWRKRRKKKTKTMPKCNGRPQYTPKRDVGSWKIKTINRILLIAMQ